MASFLLTKDNKFKPGDIITQFKTPTWYFRPAKKVDRQYKYEFRNLESNKCSTNGDYTLQRLDTLDLTPLLEKDSPIYQKAQMNKEMIDNGDYRLWVKDDVDTIKKKCSW